MPIDYTTAKEQLVAAVVADILDEMGYSEQVMDAAIRPLQPESLVVGRARTVLAVPEFSIPAKPYDQQIAATDALEPGDIMVAHLSQITACAFWGELFSTAARMRGAVGAVMDGYDVPIRCGGMLVHPGDLLAGSTLRAAWEKHRAL